MSKIKKAGFSTDGVRSTITTYFFLLRVLNKPIFIKNLRLTSNGGWRPRPGSIPDAVVARLFGQNGNSNSIFQNFIITLPHSRHYELVFGIMPHTFYIIAWCGEVQLLTSS